MRYYGSRMKNYFLKEEHGCTRVYSHTVNKNKNKTKIHIVIMRRDLGSLGTEGGVCFSAGMKLLI